MIDSTQSTESINSNDQSRYCRGVAVKDRQVWMRFDEVDADRTMQDCLYAMQHLMTSLYSYADADEHLDSRGVAPGSEIFPVFMG